MPETKPPNPIYEHFTRGNRWPSMRQSYWLTVGLVLACTAVMVWLPLAQTPYLLFNDLILPGGIGMISPVLFSVYTVYLAHRLIWGFDHQMLRITPLSNAEVLDGITLVALFRLRLLRAITIGLMPVNGLLFATTLHSLRSGSQPQPRSEQVILTVAFGIVYAGITWINQWVSISLGVNFVQLYDSRRRAMFLAVLTTLIMSGTLYLVNGFTTFVMTALVLYFLCPGR